MAAPALCHKLIAETAKEIAAAEYELNASLGNDFYKAYPSQKKYVRRHWKNSIGTARKMLIRCLGSSNLSEAQKEIIEEAIMLDRTLPQGEAKINGIIH